VQLLDSGAPVARQTRRVLQAGDGLVMTEKRGTVTLCASAAEHALKHAAQRWLDSESASAPKRE
jgi:glutamate racemase